MLHKALPLSVTERNRDAMSGPQSEGDLRNTGMALKHDREWDYELDRIVDAVHERDAETVLEL